MARGGAKPVPDKPAKGSLLWVQGLASGALLTFAAPTVLVAGVLLAPAIACALGEKTSHHGMTRAVALCCAAAALGPLWHLWMAGDHLDTALALISDAFTLVLAWGAGACAWALCQVLPVLIRAVWDVREIARGHAIEAEIVRTKKEWDLSKAGAPPQTPPRAYSP